MGYCDLSTRVAPTRGTRGKRKTWCLGGLFVVVLGCLCSLLVGSAFGVVCPNAGVRVGGSAHLPDCRAYELVTPVEKDGGKVFFSGVGPGGESVMFTSFAGFGGPVAGEGFPSFAYSASRSAGGWESLPAAPSGARFINIGEGELGLTEKGPVVSGDVGVRVWELHELGQPDNTAGFYLIGRGGVSVDVGLGGVPVAVGPATPPGAGSLFSGNASDTVPAKIVGLSADASRVFFYPEGGYEWPGVGGRGALLEYIGVGNSVPLAVGVGAGGCPFQTLGGELPRHEEGELPEWSHNAVSLDGRTVFFTDASTREAFKSPLCEHQVYARIDNGEPGAETVAISEPSKEDCPACKTFEGEPSKRLPAYFLGASENGSRVFFSTSQPLLGDDTTENLYEYDFDAPAGERVVRMSGGDGTVSNPVANVQGVLQVSEDGSHVYFVATGVLTTVPNSEGEQAREGADNLYVFDSMTGAVAFVGRLAPNDSELWEGYKSPPRGSCVTPDGRFLVFESHADLTPDDTSTAAQVFEYDAQSGVLVRVSVGEEGYNDDGNTFLSSVGKYASDPEQDHSLEDPDDALLRSANYEGSYSAATYYNWLDVSSDGSFVVFESSDGLTPEALNNVRIHPAFGEELEGDYGALYAENVYEYHDGGVFLISDGRDATAELTGSSVGFGFGTDPSGRDVFFTTTDQLVSQDTDSQLDVYDARVDGGFPAVQSAVECSGDVCQGPLSSAPVLLSPGSEFQAGGNPPVVAASVAPQKTGTSKKKLKAKKTRKRVKRGKRARGATGRRSGRLVGASGVRGRGGFGGGG